MKIEEVIQHHLVQNQGQKLSTHMIYGLVHLISHNIRDLGLSVDSDKHKEYLSSLVPVEASHD